jgi:hypothetical protein
MNKPTLRTLLKGYDVYLVSYGHGDERRFIDQFRRTWKRFPLWARRRILRHWRRLSAGQWQPPGYNPYACAELVHGWSDGPIRAVGDGVIKPGDAKEHWGPYAAVNGNGRILRFHAPRFDIMPDDIAQDLIGHELIHVLQFAEGYMHWFGTAHPSPGEIEQRTDEAMGDCFGFDPESVDRWAARVGLVKERVVSVKEYIDYYYGPVGRYYRQSSEHTDPEEDAPVS